MSDDILRIERRILPSAIRRGRMATSPVWDVTDGTHRWRFQTRRAAQHFIAYGAAIDPRMMSGRWHGYLVHND